MPGHGRTRTPTCAYSRSSGVYTRRSRQPGSPARPHLSTTTGPSASCGTRPASHAAGSDPAARRSSSGSRRLTGELSRLRKEVELPCAPIHGDYKLGNVGELPELVGHTFDLDFAGSGSGCTDIAASLHHVAPTGELLDPRRQRALPNAWPRRPASTRNEHRSPPAALALYPCARRPRGLLGGGIHAGREVQ